MKIICEVSKPHYHPGPDFSMNVTKKRDISQPGQWVANERIEKDGKSYAIIMPPRAEAFFEERQIPHFHCDKEWATILGIQNGEKIPMTINGTTIEITVKITEIACPRVHFDHVDAEKYQIQTGDVATLVI